MLVDVIDFRPDLPLEKTLGKNVAVIDVLRFHVRLFPSMVRVASV